MDAKNKMKNEDPAVYLLRIRILFWDNTSLIKLSPKKTWEGFLGAFVATMITAFMPPILGENSLFDKFVDEQYTS